MMHGERQKYALITGAASGMGRAYALQLAMRGYAILAVDRDEAANRRLEQLLSEQTNAPCRWFTMDLAQPDAAHEVLAWLEGEQIEVEVLVCNAGVLAFGGFAALTEQRIEQILQLHCATHTALVHALGGRMRERGHGYILWVSSATAWMPYPSIALYAATKSYIKRLAEALYDEWRGNGVVVTTLCPGAVDTPFYRLDDHMRRWLLRLGVMLSPDEVVRRALRALFKGRKRITPGWAAKAMVLVGRLTPSWVIRRIVRLKRVQALLE